MGGISCCLYPQARAHLGALPERERTLVAMYTDALRQFSPQTHCHSLHVAALTDQLCAEEPESVRQLAIGGAYVHDIGKIAIDQDILVKPGRLTPEEFAQVQRHPHIGYFLLEHSLPLHAIIAATHHEEGRYGLELERLLRRYDVPTRDRVRAARRHVAIADYIEAALRRQDWGARSILQVGEEISRRYDMPSHAARNLVERYRAA